MRKETGGERYLRESMEKIIKRLPTLSNEEIGWMLEGLSKDPNFFMANFREALLAEAAKRLTA